MLLFLLAAALALFLLGLRLSAFFSGCETGFYRVSFLRLSMEAHSGDRRAARILWFARNPSYFVATALVGNNVANYLTTLAIGLATTVLIASHSGWVEILGTLLAAPVVFVFGELVPKNLYYRAPMHLLRRNVRWFTWFFRLFFPVSFPLIWTTWIFQKLGRSADNPLRPLLGRSRLAQLLEEGQEHGLLTDVQSRLVHGVLHTSAQSVADSITPVARVLGLPDTATRDEFLEHARHFGLTAVPVRRPDQPDGWYGYVRVAEAAVTRRPIAALIHRMPRIEAGGSRLESLLALRSAVASYGIVVDGDRVKGIVSERGLLEQLFRSPQTSMVHFPVTR